ncbi:K(+)-transporting ATPase subunit F [Chryseolinea sp. T2]|uniref:K(+)-transporting ATPase subunit F n=1 Tax=Chryseolinea sp. T2 TaxID=3129255 RepID=UPI0030782636
MITLKHLNAEVLARNAYSCDDHTKTINTMMTILLIIGALVFTYLVYALIKPERF